MNVYFIKTGDAIKVGVASDIDKRMVSIQVGNPHKLRLLHSISTSDEIARKIESEIHQLFHKTNLNGEWFQGNQFMIDFIDQIKKNGWDSHAEWIKNQYNNTYGDTLQVLKEKLEHDIIRGNIVSLDRLKKDLGELVNEIFMIPSLPINIAEAVRQWIDKRKEPFMMDDIYSEFGISTRKGKKNISAILNRLVVSDKLQKTGKLPRFIYKKNV